jgi:glutathione S-transferase
MIVLHHCMSARSFRPLWALEELRLPYQLRMLPFPPRVLKREYLAINPLGTVPYLTDGATAMSESSAICEYLAACYGDGALSVAPGDAAFGAYLNWLHFGEATLTFPQTLVLRYGRFEPVERRSPQVADDYSRWFLARLRTISPVLETWTYICGERFTAADISVGYALMLADYIGLAEQFPDSVAAYWERLQRRDGHIAALQAQSHAASAQGVSLTPAPLTE